MMIHAFSTIVATLWCFIQLASLIAAIGIYSATALQASLNHSSTTRKSMNNSRSMTFGHADFLDSTLQRHADAETVPDTNIVSAYITKSSGLNVSAVSVGLSEKDMAQLNGDWGKITFPVLATSGGALPPANDEHVFDEHVKNRQAWEMPLPHDVQNLNDRADYLAVVSSFKIYGREPACTAAYSSFIATEPMTLSTSTSFSYSDLGNGQYTVMTSNIIQNVSAGAQGYCCGGAGPLLDAQGCLIYADKLQLLYWPPSHPNAACLGKTAASLINNRTTLPQITSAPNPVVSNLSVYAIGLDGYKYESPSIYIIYSSLFAVDRCGSVSPSLTSLTLAFEPGELSTVIYNARAGSFTTLALNLNDLPCDPLRSRPALLPPSSSNLVVFLAKETDYIILHSINSPFLALPSKIIDVVPAWSGCAMDPHGGYDPPRPLSPATAMNPVQTAVQLTPQSTTAIPSPPIPSLPSETGTILPRPSLHYPDQGFPPIGEPPPEAGSHSDAKYSTSASPPTNPEPTPGSVFPSIHQDDGRVVVPRTTNFPSVLDPDEYSRSAQAFVGDRSQGKDSTLVEDMNSLTFDSWNPEQGKFEGPLATWSKEPESTQKEDAGDPYAKWSRDSDFTRVENPEFTRDGTVLSPLATEHPKPNPPAVAIEGQTITNNAAPITIGGAKVAYQSGVLSVDSKMLQVPLSTVKWSKNPSLVIVGDLSFSVLPAAAQSDLTHPVENAPGAASLIDKYNIPPDKHLDSFTYITVGGQTFTLQSNAIQVAGKTLEPGDPAITVDGTPIFLGVSAFVVGTRTEVFSLPTISATPETVVTVDDVKITPEGSTIVVAGVTIAVGEPATTINGIPISLGSSVLVVGSQTRSFAYPTDTMGTHNYGNLDELLVPGLGGIGGGVVDAPSRLNTGTIGTSSVETNTPLLGQTIKLSVSVWMYRAWAIMLLTVFVIWS